jgi:hypothetical protein
LDGVDICHHTARRTEHIKIITKSGLMPEVFMKSNYTNHLPTAEGRQPLLLNEALVLLVRLVPIAVFLLWLQLLGQLLEDHLQQLLLARLVLCVTVPDRNLDRVPADRV